MTKGWVGRCCISPTLRDQKLKSAGEQDAQIAFRDLVRLVAVDEQDRQVFAEFRGKLATRTARRMTTRCGDGECSKASMSGGDGRAEGDPLGADRQAERRILDVAAADDLTEFGQQGGPDQKLRVRRVSVFTSFACEANQIGALVIGHWSLVIGHWSLKFKMINDR